MPSALTLDYRAAFDQTPSAWVLSRRRLMVNCKAELLAMFDAEGEQADRQTPGHQSSHGRCLPRG